MSNYILKIKNLSLDNKYTKWYVQIIERAIIRANSKKKAKHLLGYIEAHHILPKCLCETKYDKSNKNNYAYLTAREHYITHWLLCKMLINKKHLMYFSFSMLSSKKKLRKFTSHQYEILRKYNSISRQFKKTNSHGGLKGELNPMYGRSAVTENNLRWYNNGLTNLYITEGTEPLNFKPGRLRIKNDGSKIRKPDTTGSKNGMYGKRGNLNPNFKSKRPTVSESNKIRFEYERKSPLICPYCNRVGSGPTMKRYHFHNCKLCP